MKKMLGEIREPGIVVGAWGQRGRVEPYLSWEFSSQAELANHARAWDDRKCHVTRPPGSSVRS